jgi:hypothetical protein
VRTLSHLDSNFESAQKKVVVMNTTTTAPATSSEVAPPFSRAGDYFPSSATSNGVAIRGATNPLSALPQMTRNTSSAIAAPPTAMNSSSGPCNNNNNSNLVTLVKFAGCNPEDEAYMALGADTGDLMHLVTPSGVGGVELVSRSGSSSRLCSQLLGRKQVLGKERMVYRLAGGGVARVDSNISGGGGSVVMLGPYLQDQLSSGNYFRVSELLSMLLDVAEGIAALHRENTMHGNLCPQNVFYVPTGAAAADQQKAASSSASLPSSSLIVSGYGCLPVAKNFRYSAPEALQQATVQGDVWAFGVLAWELCQYCSVIPMPEASTRKQFVDALQAGARLRCPEQCPPNLFLRIIRPCFAELSQRPTMSSIAKDIADLLLQVSSD